MAWFRRAAAVQPTIGPTTIDPLVAQWHRRLAAGPLALDPDLAGLFGGTMSTAWMQDRVGVANRCLQLVSQNVASLRFRYRRRAGRDQTASDPAWLASPDPNWFPNGFRDAIFACVWAMYGFGDAFLYITSRYADGFPASWTVLAPDAVTVDTVGGRRTYEAGGVALAPDDVVQISRDPRGNLRGTSALAAYASNLEAAYTAERFAATVFSGGGIPPAILQSSRRLDAEQAAAVQAQWVVGGQTNPGAPRVLPPELAFLGQAFSPKDMALIESRGYDAEQIAAAFGVPAPLLNLPLPASGLTYTNTTSLAEFWWRFELLPGPVEAICVALSTMVPSGNWIEADASRYLKPDLPTLVTTLSKLLEDGVITLEEYRAMLDFPPADAPIQDFDEPPTSGTTVLMPGPAPVPPTLEVVSQ